MHALQKKQQIYNKHIYTNLNFSDFPNSTKKYEKLYIFFYYQINLSIYESSTEFYFFHSILEGWWDY